MVLATSCSTSDSNTDLKGYPASVTKFVHENFMLLPLLSTSQIQQFILQNNADHSPASASQLARDVKVVAHCFGVDERFLVAQIYQESRFNPRAESPTHAVGLMQLTGIGITEIEDQLGHRGTDYAGAAAIEYFKNLLRTCINPSFDREFADSTFLWQRVPSNDLRAKKEIILAEARVGLVYGVIMLKTLLSKSMSENRSRDLNATYDRALWLYNGDPVEQSHYRNVIVSTAHSFDSSIEMYSSFGRPMPDDL